MERLHSEAALAAFPLPERNSNEAGPASYPLSGEEQFMATGALTRVFMTFAVPGICGILFISLQTLADGLLLGHFAGAASMAAVNVALPCFSVLLAVALVVSVGCETLVSIGMGKGERAMANNAFTTAVLTTLVFAAAWGMALFALAPWITARIGADAGLLPLCVDYLRALAPFFPAVALLFLTDYVLKSLGRPLYAMSVMTGVVVLNVLLDVLFIAGFGWGVTGAAVATGISYAVGMLLDLIPLCTGRMPLRLMAGRFHWKLLRRVLACGSAEGCSEMATGIAIMLFNIMLMRHVGAVGIAAFTILNYMQYVAMATFLGMSDGIRPVVGYSFGRQQPDRVRGIMARALLGVTLLGALFGSVLFWFGGDILSVIFSPDDAAVVAMAVEGSRFMAVALAVQGINLLCVGYYTSIGKPRVAIMLVFVRSLGLMAVGLFVLPPLFGATGIWMVPPLAELLTLLLTVPLLRKGLRKGAL